MILSCSKEAISIIKTNNSDFFLCLNYLQSFRTKNKLELHKKTCESKNVYSIIMPSGDTKILEFN